MSDILERLENRTNQTWLRVRLDAAEEIRALRSHLAELQRQLDEAAKQAPVWYLHFPTGIPVNDRIEELKVDDLTPLYALPPNLPAMIEQAVREEREACAKVCESMIENIDENYAAKRPDEAEGDYIANAVKQNCADAIRARGEKR